MPDTDKKILPSVKVVLSAARSHFPPDDVFVTLKKRRINRFSWYGYSVYNFRGRDTEWRFQYFLYDHRIDFPYQQSGVDVGRLIGSIYYPNVMFGILGGELVLVRRVEDSLSIDEKKKEISKAKTLMRKMYQKEYPEAPKYYWDKGIDASKIEKRIEEPDILTQGSDHVMLLRNWY